MKKKLCILCTILIAAGLFFFMRQEIDSQHARKMAAEQLNEDLIPLQNEIIALINTKNELNSAYNKQVRGSATFQLLAPVPIRTICDDVAPMMKEFNDPTAVVGISLRAFPGQEEMMSARQARKLAEEGWSFCYCFAQEELDELGEGKAAMEAWLDAVQELAENMNLELQPAVYFPLQEYREEYEPWLQAAGIQAVIRRQEDAKHMSVSPVQHNGFWIIDCAGWNSSGASAQLKSTIQSSGNLTLCIGNAKNGEVFEEKAFRSMLTRINSYQKQDSLEISDFLRMVEARQETGVSASYQHSYDVQIQNVEDRLAQIKNEIEKRIEQYEHELAGGNS